MELIRFPVDGSNRFGIAAHVGKLGRLLLRVGANKVVSLPIPIVKRCAKCGVEKPLIEFANHSKTRDGLQYWCKECKSENHQKNKNKPVKRRIVSSKPGMKYCCRCGEEKPTNLFSKSKYSKDGLKHSCKVCDKKFADTRVDYRRKYREENKIEIKENKRKYYYDNIDDISIKNANYRNSHKDEKKKYDQEYIKRDPEYQRLRHLNYRENNEEKLLQYWIDYNKDHREERILYNKIYNITHKEENHSRLVKYRQTSEGKASVSRCRNNRRYKSKKCKNTLTANQWNKILEMQNNYCAFCCREFGEKLKPTKDHIIPAYLGWGLTFGNTQALCQSCNSKKHIKVDFMKAMYELLEKDNDA